MEVSLAAPTAQGRTVDLSEAAFGELRSTGPDLSRREELLSRLEEDGYLFLRGFFPREQILAARHDLLVRLLDIGWLREGSDPHEAFASQTAEKKMLRDVAKASTPLQEVLYGEHILGFYQRLFGENVRHFDTTWLRAYPPGSGTAPHMDTVFMGRGSKRLMTAWVPWGDIDTILGGLAVLEGSHLLKNVRNDYGTRDVDVFCTNKPGADVSALQETYVWNGNLSDDPVGLREELGLRWLTADFSAGDLVTFPLYTVHTGLDNNTDRIRLSSDSRYQPASEPADPRWVGPNPSGHGSAAKIGVIC
ncbi:MAG TPA: phytanoyl-CoA dioxygenase family protein [Acidimicrobiales bacterium]|nr:phytanoyl-CoA dioxygenase family protein [Acidimicrobiales bacterium]